MKMKDRRHSGWYTPGTTLSMPLKELIDNCLEPQLVYDEWTERRDGMRFPLDDSKIRSEFCFWPDKEQIKAMNKKHKKHATIRWLRKYYKESPPPYLV